MTKSAGSAIPSLASDPRTAVAAGAAREAMNTALAVSSYVCAGLLVLALAATLFLARGATAAAPQSAAGAREPTSP